MYRILAALLFLSGSAFAQSSSSSIVMTIEGRDGPIEGDITLRRDRGKIRVYGWSHEVVSPRDAASGLPTGRRQHKPFTITKPIDRASPLLFNALAHNENLPRVRIEFYYASRRGVEELYYTVELTNASIVAFGGRGGRTLPTLDVKPEKNRLDIERVSFVYQQITVTYEDPAIQAQDDWEAPQG